MWIVADVAVTHRHRTVDKPFGESDPVMTDKAELRFLSLQSVTILGLMRIVTADAVSLSYRRMPMILEHHIPLVLMATEAERLFFRCKLEFMILSRNRVVANRANLRPHRPVDKRRRTHRSVTFGSDTTAITNRHGGHRETLSKNDS